MEAALIDADKALQVNARGELVRLGRYAMLEWSGLVFGLITKEEAHAVPRGGRPGLWALWERGLSCDEDPERSIY